MTDSWQRALACSHLNPSTPSYHKWQIWDSYSEKCPNVIRELSAAAENDVAFENDQQTRLKITHVTVKCCSVNGEDAESSTSHQRGISPFLQLGAHAGRRAGKLPVASVPLHSCCDKHAIYFLITLWLIYRVWRQAAFRTRGKDNNQPK